MPWACQYPRLANHDHLPRIRDESRILSRIRSLSRPIRCSSTARPSTTLTTMCNMARGTRTTSLRRCDRENERVPEQRQDDTGQCSARISSPKSPDPTATSASCPWRGVQSAFAIQNQLEECVVLDDESYRISIEKKFKGDRSRGGTLTRMTLSCPNRNDGTRSSVDNWSCVAFTTMESGLSLPMN